MANFSDMSEKVVRSNLSEELKLPTCSTPKKMPCVQNTHEVSLFNYSFNL